MDEKLYNVYSFKVDSDEDPTLEGEGLYEADAQKLAYEIRERGPLWDSYIIDCNEDAGPFMRRKEVEA